jgi:hypothetical protein
MTNLLVLAVKIGLGKITHLGNCFQGTEIKPNQNIYRCFDDGSRTHVCKLRIANPTKILQISKEK